ncbi:tripartite tricarboxylate transporter substrate binding protein [Pigmentiphaga soli]|uniref:Tripartite tricarboxylate transporter substrate binding protein n=1 Tax=Pigmentiphaga soli TaxID=1007095 RepID=A0ABP8GKM1_9BURK
MIAVLLGCAALAGAAQADEAWPAKPVRLVACCAGIIDAIARVVADEMTGDLKQPVVVETKPGASGMIGADFVAKSAPDGYTLFIGTNSTHAANQSLYVKVPYDYVHDFAPINGIAVGPIMMVVRADSPIKSVADLTAAARDKPGKLTFGWASSSTRVAMELYNQLAKVRIMSVPYKTNPQATTDLVGGQIDVMFADMATAVPMVKGGKLRPLAISGKRRVAVLPDVPTMEEAGVPGYDLTWWVAAWAPSKTPRDIVDRLNASIAKAIATPKALEFFKTIAVDPMPMTPGQLMQFQMAEHGKWGRVISLAGIEPQ